MTLKEIIDSWRLTPQSVKSNPPPVGPSSFQVLETKQLLPKDLLAHARKVEPHEMNEAIKAEIKAHRKHNEYIKRLPGLMGIDPGWVTLNSQVLNNVTPAQLGPSGSGWPG